MDCSAFKGITGKTCCKCSGTVALPLHLTDRRQFSSETRMVTVSRA